MILILLANGASVIPFFIPGIPQLLLVLATLKVLLAQRLPVSLPVLLLLLGLSLLLVLAALHSLPDQAGRFAKLAINASVAYAFSAGLVRRYGENFPDVYSQALLFFTVTGILGSLLTLVTDWSITYILLDRTYHTNLLTTWLRDGTFNSSQTFISPLPYRLQSMFDEPGTFGILLVPAFFYFVQQGKTAQAIILLTGALLSESPNAWVLCLLILVGKVWMLDSKPQKIGFFTLLAVLLAAAAPAFIQLYEIKTGLDEAYANSSSLGTRSLEYAYVQQHWDRHFLPFQDLYATAQFPNGISVSYVSWYIDGGLIFVMMLATLVVSLARMSARGRRSGDPTRHFQLVLAILLLLSGTQRTSLFDNVLFMSLAFWTLLHRPARVRKIHGTT